MPREPSSRRKSCDFCGRTHRILTVRQCLLGKRGQRGVLWTTLKEAIQIRDRNRCARCGGYCIGEDQHMSHVYRAGRCGYLKYDLQNVMTLDAQCHRWWHEYEVESGTWFVKTFPDRWEYLQVEIVKYRQLPGTIPMPFYRERFDELQAYIVKEKGL